MTDSSALPPVSGRFVVLRHEMPPQAERASHWDLMLERGERLATWAIAGSPESLASLPAEQLDDHRPDYLDYEGPVSGGRGQVTRWDQGLFKTVVWNDEAVVVSLVGERLRGVARLERKAAGDQRTGFVFSFSEAE